MFLYNSYTETGLKIFAILNEYMTRIPGYGFSTALILSTVTRKLGMKAVSEHPSQAKSQAGEPVEWSCD